MMTVSTDPLPPLPKPTPDCQARNGTKRCGRKAVAKRDEQPRYVCEECLRRLEMEEQHATN